MIKTIISGGQTGADRGGLIAAKSLKLPHGGWIGKYFLTENGSEPWLEEEFGLQPVEQSGSNGYRTRTKHNVRDSDGTIRIAANFTSSGYKRSR
jgi:hypothetical protein